MSFVEISSACNLDRFRNASSDIILIAFADKTRCSKLSNDFNELGSILVNALPLNSKFFRCDRFLNQQGFIVSTLFSLTKVPLTL